VTSSQKIKLDELLGRWEEPEVVGEHDANISIASILQFRQMLAYMDEDYPFSVPFGPADTRETCVESAQNLYSRLMLLNPDEPVLPFDTLAVLAKDKDGEIKVDEMKNLIRLFRPDRNGNLTCVDFVKSCDEVYKEMRMLRASIANSGQVDHAFEILVNIMFYLIVGIVILVVLNVNPLSLFVSVSVSPFTAPDGSMFVTCIVLTNAFCICTAGCHSCLCFHDWVSFCKIFRGKGHHACEDELFACTRN
jgi:hypothetical protein